MILRLTFCVVFVTIALLLQSDSLTRKASASMPKVSMMHFGELGSGPQTERRWLHELEHRKSERWNYTGSKLLVLGQKARRDFGVYSWAFSHHGFKVFMPPSGIIDLSTLDRDASSGPTHNVGGLLCHSLFLSNCIRRTATWSSSMMAGGLPGGGPERVYAHVRGRKINRLAAVREVLSTKDGLCATLRASQLPPTELSKFTFPCWVLPQDHEVLAAHLRGDTAAAAPVAATATLWPFYDDGGTTIGLERRRIRPLRLAASAPQEPPQQEPSPGWIVKPAHGSQGQGIRLYNSSAELAARLGSTLFLSESKRVPLVVQPYLRSPRLHHGRKWDVRTYVLVTSATPMRLYLFSEAIVRYSSSVYSPGSTHAGAVLTNTYVGKKLLNTGVGAITGSLADLCDETPGGELTIGGDGGANFSCAGLMSAMSGAIGGIFLAAEPRLRRVYSKEYAKMVASEEGENGILGGLGGSADPFRCAPCYHLFGVDLIADESGGMHVIEVNVEPDLTLSTEGECAVKRMDGNCSEGSLAYDHTKHAAAFNTVRLVYARKAQAGTLQRMLERNAARIAKLPLLLMPAQPPLPPPPPKPSLGGLLGAATDLGMEAAEEGQPEARPPPAQRPEVPVLLPQVAEYLLDWLRETEASGCFMPVYPSLTHRTAHATQLRLMSTDEHRLQMHALLMLALEDVASGAGGGAHDAEGAAARASSNSFKRRCESMLRKVPRVKQGAWARRTHIFKQVWDL